MRLIQSKREEKNLPGHTDFSESLARLRPVDSTSFLTLRAIRDFGYIFEGRNKHIKRKLSWGE